MHPRGVLWTLPSLGAFLAPVGVCPACWPLYTSLLAAAGLSFLTEAAYLLPIALAFAAAALAPLAYRAIRGGRYGQLALGTGAASLALAGKFLAASSALLYGGLVLLVGASIWSWRQIPGGIPGMAGSCAKCAPYLPAHSLIERKGGESNMKTKRTIEIFSAGCPACEETITLVNRVACPSCDVQVFDMHSLEVAAKAKSYGIRSVPAVVIDGKLAGCCAGRGPEEAALRAAGLGVPG